MNEESRKLDAHVCSECCNECCEASETEIKLAAKRDVNAGKLTDTTKLILRHELGPRPMTNNSMSIQERYSINNPKSGGPPPFTAVSPRFFRCLPPRDRFFGIL